MRRLKNTGSEDMKQHYLRYFSSKPCHAWETSRLRAESRAVTIHGMSIAALSKLRVEEALEWLKRR